MNDDWSRTNELICHSFLPFWTTLLGVQNPARNHSIHSLVSVYYTTVRNPRHKKTLMSSLWHWWCTVILSQIVNIQPLSQVVNRTLFVTDRSLQVCSLCFSLHLVLHLKIPTEVMRKPLHYLHCAELGRQKGLRQERGNLWTKRVGKF